ncbi:EthD family reductase [Ramlibacter sp.]|uniref:EthD family reductase n=1 Tax=Ramlibacter sp. TaxID=1917967 RepID=UPI002D43519E|nr:EthD family reductase [Ramlibacter sp.]HYD75187.1 EthD family reductase [Ramlibacter sp.]
MIKFNVLYPYSEGMRFDHAYYRDKHMPMVAALLGEACRGYTVDRGLAGGAPGAPPPFAAACSVFADSAEQLQAALAPHAAEIMGDISNYTDAKPVIWISDAVVDRA